MTTISSVYVPPSAPMAAQVAARPTQQAGGSFDVAAGQTSSLASTATPVTTVTSQDKTDASSSTQNKPDLLASLQSIEAQLAVRAKQAADINTLDISYDKKQAELSVKVMQEQTGKQVRELAYKDYQAMGYSSHGYKGSVINAIA